MLRRIFSGVIESIAQNQEGITNYNPFTKAETIPFGWLTNYAPCFPISVFQIKILSTPQQFYDTILDGCKNAKKRIILASLYLGTGSLEIKLRDELLNNPYFKNGNLKIRVLLDYTRGSRFQDNSRTVLKSLLEANDKNCQVSLYHTPVLRGLLKKLAPNRWNELFGLQHMKLYIFDNILIISGANLSNDYFTNRQDRYFVIHDERLCDFYSGLLNQIEKFSLKMDRDNNVALSEDWPYLPYEGNRQKFIEEAADIVEEYLEQANNDQKYLPQSGYDTWVFPLVQMGQLGINQDVMVTDRIFAETPPGSCLKIATGYFNLTKQYKRTLIKSSKADCQILMAHPKANGFLGAKGVAGGIPFAYAYIADEFRQQFSKYHQDNRIKLYEYLRENWTYHAKGLWYFPPNSSKPCLTLIGSPNFGERSVNRDLETQLAIVTENEELQEKLRQECDRIYKHGNPAETDRIIPKWVQAFVLFFRNYF